MALFIWDEIILYNLCFLSKFLGCSLSLKLLYHNIELLLFIRSNCISVQPPPPLFSLPLSLTFTPPVSLNFYQSFAQSLFLPSHSHPLLSFSPSLSFPSATALDHLAFALRPLYLKLTSRNFLTNV